jgi:hypothetical protein
VRLSDPAVDSRSPTVTTLADGRAQVAFQTPFGDAIRILYWAEPTIVDDLNPVGAAPVKQLGPGGP